MRTVAELSENIIKESPYLEEALTLGIVNLSSLARKLKPKIEAKILKKTSLPAIVMALLRLGKKLKKHNLGKLKTVLPKDLTVKSNLVEFVYQTSANFSKNQALLSQQLKHEPNEFFSTTLGIFESTVIVSASQTKVVEKIFSKEKLFLKLEGLSALILRFSENTIEVPGVNYYILKSLAWDNITMAEIISVGSELTLILENNQVDRAFMVVKSLIK